MKFFWNVVFSAVLASCLASSDAATPIKVMRTIPAPTELAVYRDVTNKFELTYSRSDFQIDSYQYPGVAVDFLLNLEDNFPGKNLEEVSVSIAANPECHFIKVYGATAFIEDATINGISFKKISIRDSGSGINIFETITYQTTHKGNCYEIHTSIREYRTDRVPNLTEYSRTLLDKKVDALVETFRFIE
jgi:hypothetical protein